MSQYLAFFSTSLFYSPFYHPYKANNSKLLFIFSSSTLLMASQPYSTCCGSFLRMAATTPPLPLCICHSSHCRVVPSSPLLDLGQLYDLLWPAEYGRSDILLVVSLLFKRSGSFHFLPWKPVPGKKGSSYPETTML